MILYRKGGIDFVLNIFRMKGSAFPAALRVALPCSLVAGALRFSAEQQYWNVIAEPNSVLSDTAVWNGFSFLVGFLIVFRTSQANSRFWEGCTSAYRMRADWLDACSSLVAFCRFSSASHDDISAFQNMLIRLFSMLHAAALAEIEDVSMLAGKDHNERAAFDFELIDIFGVDNATLDALESTECKVDLLFSWIQAFIVDNMKNGVLSIPPPILSRAFNEIADGMVAFNEASKISSIPLPFPYAQACDTLLCLHAFTTPFVVAKWVYSPLWSIFFCFIQVFVLWALDFIAMELENPFGSDPNDLDTRRLQLEMNQSLILLLTPQSTQIPHLTAEALRFDRISVLADLTQSVSNRSIAAFSQAWRQKTSQPELVAPAPAPTPVVTDSLSVRKVNSSFGSMLSETRKYASAQIGQFPNRGVMLSETRQTGPSIGVTSGAAAGSEALTPSGSGLDFDALARERRSPTAPSSEATRRGPKFEAGGGETDCSV